jgi:hypothetical protein
MHAIQNKEVPYGRSGPMMLTIALCAVFSTATHAFDAQQSEPANTIISLTRSACFGDCPNYTVVIHGDGQVRFTTDISPVSDVDAIHRQFAQSKGVLVPGTHQDRVLPQSVADLLAQFQRVGFWGLQDRYEARVTDNPTQIITLEIGGRKKKVVDYVGTEAGMPQSVRDLEDSIDRVAGTARWVNGTTALIPWLVDQKFDFHSMQAAELAVAAERGAADQATVLALIDHGAPLNLPVSGDPSSIDGTPDLEPGGILMAQAAIFRGHAEVFRYLAKAGWIARWGKNNAAESFAMNAAGCSPELVDAVAAAGVDVDASQHPRPRAYAGEGQSRTALSELVATYSCNGNEDAQLRTAKRLLAHGANPNHRDSLGRTPLYGIENLQLLNFLLAKGADATIKSNDGESVIFGSWTDTIVLRLLQAGASPVGHYHDGKTLAQQTVSRDMPQVAKWLADHPESYQR